MNGDDERIRVGFTGSRHLSAWQRATIESTLEGLVACDPSPIVITGGCVGVDAYVAEVAHERGLEVHTVLPSNPRLVDRAWRDHCTSYEQLPHGTDYRDRNERLVALSGILIAFPEHQESHQQARRSGTWMTIRIAERLGLAITINIEPSTEDDDVGPV